MFKSNIMNFVLALILGLYHYQAGAEMTASDSSNNVAVLLYKTFAQEEGKIFFSPLGINIALSMLKQGAKGNTLEEMQQVLGKTEIWSAELKELAGMDTKTERPYSFNIANALASSKNCEVLPNYKSDLKASYHAEVFEEDFEKDGDGAVERINSWVGKHTNGKIPQLIDSLDKRTNLVLLNAIYFKAKWLSPFHPDATEDSTFYNNGDKSQAAKIRMMNGVISAGIREDEKVKVLNLPYEGDRISMLVVLPNEMCGLAGVEQTLEKDFVKNSLEGMENTRVRVSLPKFDFEYSKRLKSAMIQLGLKSLFGQGDTDLTGISEKDHIHVSEIIHKAVVTVTEEGTEAASGTAVLMVGSSGGSPKEFVADHPFIFVIYDKMSKTILFMGRVNKL